MSYVCLSDYPLLGWVSFKRSLKEAGYGNPCKPRVFCSQRRRG